MALDLSGKTVFISGASAGIGAACAQQFASLGCKLLLCARRIDKLQQLKQQLETEFSVPIFCFELDVRERTSVENSISSLDKNFLPIDILLNNAGLAAGAEKLYQAKIDDWERMIDTNVKGLLYLTRCILPKMVERNSGHVINIGSIAGREPYPGGSVYCASKHAVRAISRSLKMDLQGTQIRVSNIEPGAVETEFSLVRYNGNKQKADAVYQGMEPLRAGDVADAVLYAATRPLHVNVSELLVLANAQASAYHIAREEE